MAIFFVKEEALNGGVTAEQVLDEAKRAADGYMKKNSSWGRRLEKIPGLLYGAAGALLTGAVWALTALLP